MVAVLALFVAAGCLSGIGPGSTPTAGPDTTTSAPDPATTTDPAPTTDPETASASPGGTATTELEHGAHGDPYSVDLRITAEPVEGDVPVEDVPNVTTANLTDRQRTLLVGLLESGTTATWSGTSDETPPERIRVLAAVADRLPPSPWDRDPSETWRVARGAEGYVVHEGTTYRVSMVKVAP